MNVVQAIQKLLFLEDCVIIPGLGGFVSQYRPAAIDKATGTFIPPTKEIVFNNELVQNDGVLVSYLARHAEVSINVARNQVDRFVEETLVKLGQNELVFVEGIGQFMLGKSREIRFLADAGSNFSLDSYGLASFHLRALTTELNSGFEKVLATLSDEKPVTVEFAVSEIRNTHRNHNLRRIAIAMPLLIAFSLLPFNSRVKDTLNSSTASMIPEPSLFRLNYPDPIQKDTTTTIVFPITPQQAPAVVETETSEAVKSTPVNPAALKSDVVKNVVTKSEAKKVVAGKYPVVAGCFKIKENAERLHKQLIDKGYPATMTPFKNGQMFKVSVQWFATRQEAVAGLEQLKKAEPKLDLWVSL